MRIPSTSQLHERCKRAIPQQRHRQIRGMELINQYLGPLQMDAPYIGHSSDSDMVAEFTFVNSWRVLPTAIWLGVKTLCP